MPFTVEDLEDLLAILQQRPEWRARVLESLLGQEFVALPHQVQKLIEAQQRTDEHIAALTSAVQALAEAQIRSEERLSLLEEQFALCRQETNERLTRLEQAIEALVEAQRRTEEQVAALTAEVRALAGAQQRAEEEFARYREQTDARLARVERGQQRLEVAFERLQTEVRNLSNIIGMTVEDEAEDMVGWVLKKRGYTIRKSVQSAVIDGEVDVILLATAPDGQQLTVVVEVKHRLGTRDVHRWAQRVQSRSYQRRLREAGYEPPYLPYMFAMRFDEPTLEITRALGIGLVNSPGEQVEGTLLISGGATR